jgi:hypothetical protein
MESAEHRNFTGNIDDGADLPESRGPGHDFDRAELRGA